MKTKLIQIKDLKPGMKIKSYENEAIVFNTVSDVWNTEVKKEDRLLLTFTNNTTLRCSSNHPIMVLLDDGSVEQKYPRELDDFDEILTDSGSTYIQDVSEDKKASSNYIDITVEDTNTFFVSNKRNQDMVLTHNSQGGVRSGSATLNAILWHKEIEDILVLKNNKGTEDNRIRDMDYCIHINKFLLQRIIEGKDITLFCPNDVPDLYDAFYADQEKFAELYEKYERSYNIKKETVSAMDLFTTLVQERKDTGRIYIMFTDHVNDHGSFIPSKAPIKMTNLCVTGDTSITVEHKNGSISEIEIKNYDSNIHSKVLSRNLSSGLNEFKNITNFALTKKKAQLMLVTDKDTGKSIKCTPCHKIYTKNRGYIEAQHLNVDDELLLE